MSDVDGIIRGSDDPFLRLTMMKRLEPSTEARRRSGMRFVALALVVLAAACGSAEVPEGNVTGRLVAGPVCPVESEPPDPECADRPLAGVGVTAIGSDGRTRLVTSSDDGHFEVRVLAGEVILRFQTMVGLPGTPEDLIVFVAAGETVDVGDVAYDTGIR